MNCPELAVTTTTTNGAPHVAIRGAVDSWHVRSVEDVLENYLSDDTKSMTVDISQATFSDAESLSIMIRSLRRSCNQMKVTVIANDRVAQILSFASFGPNVLISTSESEESVSTQPEYYTSRWMGRSAGDEEMPLAA
jgi:anti-anti-sigma regulatory factor